MSESNSQRKVVSPGGFEWAGTVARIRRSGKSMRSGQRSALLSMLTSTYVNSSRGGRAPESRGASERS